MQEDDETHAAIIRLINQTLPGILELQTVLRDVQGRLQKLEAVMVQSYEEVKRRKHHE